MGWRVKSEEATKLIADSADKEGEGDGANPINPFDDELPY
jgi:hypothetical protein